MEDYLRDLEPVILNYFLDNSLYRIVMLSQVCKRWNNFCNNYLKSPRFFEKHKELLIQCASNFFLDGHTTKVVIKKKEFIIDALLNKKYGTVYTVRFIYEVFDSEKKRILYEWKSDRNIGGVPQKKFIRYPTDNDEPVEVISISFHKDSLFYEFIEKFLQFVNLKHTRNFINYNAHTRAIDVMLFDKKRKIEE